MKLSILLNLSSADLSSDPEIADIQLDSRQVKKGDLFFALTGTKQDGAKYISQAIENGASAVVIDANLYPSIDQLFNTPIIPISNLKENLGLIAAKFLGCPANQMTVVGVTGTNGKTSTCYLMAEILEKLGKKVAIIGTLGYGRLAHLQSTGMTTPDVLSLHKIFAKFRVEGIEYVIMEVSSHALDQYRVIGIPFKIAIFSNLTRDHLDYHQTMENYALAKKKLFHWETLQANIINADDEYGYAWLQEQLNGVTIAYGASDKVKEFAKHYQIQDLAVSAQGTNFTLAHHQSRFIIHSKLLGRFNAYNLTAVIVALRVLKIDWEELQDILPVLHGVPGRMQVIAIPGKPTVVFDFAHSPDALEQVLKNLRELKPKKIICVFGCGGNRDRGKRPIMAGIAETYADHVIVTSDNPRNEDPMSIINEICSGFNGQNYLVEIDRAQAIKKAITEAQEGDIVLLAGKGHESYQIIGDEILSFDEYQIAKEFLG